MMTRSLDRRRPIIVLPDVQRAIEVDNLRRYWYVSERSIVPPAQRHPHLHPARQPPSSHVHAGEVTRRHQQQQQQLVKTCCEFRREYELNDDDHMDGVQRALQLEIDTSQQPATHHTPPPPPPPPAAAGGAGQLHLIHLTLALYFLFLECRPMYLSVRLYNMLVAAAPVHTHSLSYIDYTSALLIASVCPSFRLFQTCFHSIIGTD